MVKKIISYFFIALVILLGVSSLFYRFPGDIISDVLFNIFSSPGKHYQAKNNLHLYDNDQFPLSRALVRVYYLIASGEEWAIIDNWQEVFTETLSKVSEFYELQFSHNLELDFQIYPQVIYSENNPEHFLGLAVQDYYQELASPHSPSLAIEEIIKELQEKMKDKNQKWDLRLTTINDSYVINLVILGAGAKPLKVEEVEILGFNDENHNSLVFSSIFTAPKYENCYESIVAHEVGHGLGIPEFYTYYNNKVSSSGIMGGGFTRKLEHTYLDHQIKVKMGLK